MPHDNYTARRAYIQALVDSGEPIPASMKRETAARFECSINAIHRDIAFCRESLTGSGYRDVDAVGNQNSRAQRLGIEGTFTTQEWRTLRNRHGNRCAICGEQRPLGPDHIRPLSKGGTNWIGNIQPVCQPCNSRKGARYARSKR